MRTSFLSAVFITVLIFVTGSVSASPLFSFTNSTEIGDSINIGGTGGVLFSEKTEVTFHELQNNVDHSLVKNNFWNKPSSAFTITRYGDTVERDPIFSSLGSVDHFEQPSMFPGNGVIPIPNEDLTVTLNPGDILRMFFFEATSNELHSWNYLSSGYDWLINSITDTSFVSNVFYDNNLLWKVSVTTPEIGVGVPDPVKVPEPNVLLLLGLGLLLLGLFSQRQQRQLKTVAMS